jgi:hypothetical protein
LDDEPPGGGCRARRGRVSIVTFEIGQNGLL